MNKYLKALLISIVTVLGGIFYRMGGSGNYPRWIRPVGQGVCVVATMILCGFMHWSLILCFGATWAETTYFKPKGTDAGTFSWIMVGLVFGLIPLPYCGFTNSHWLGFGIRVPVCVGLTVLWQQIFSAKVSKALGLGKDITDEFGRGLINIATLPCLLI